jgi:hypothetical protein
MEIGATVHVEMHTDQVEKAAERAAYKNLGHAAASIRKDAIASIETSPEPSAPGQPPHTRRGRAKKAGQYFADQESAVVGFAASVIGTGMEPHEHGESRGKNHYPERPTMGPALERNRDRFADEWEGSIGP